MKTKVSLLAVVLGKLDLTNQSAPPQKERPNGRVPLRQDQCACCKEIGHWKNECPHGKGPTSETIKTAPRKKTKWQPEPEARTSLA
jgi:hypothetical protein